MNNFKITKPIRLIETFSGVGTQAMALRDLGVNFEYWATSDWDVNAVASYKAIHHDDDNTDYSVGKTKEELIEILNKLCISTDGKKPMTKKQISRKSENWLRKTYNNFKASHNLGSITEINAENLKIENKKEYIYILTYSFPCTDLSLAGRRKGMDKNSGTASSLLWEIERILKECKNLNCLPDILVMENVTQVHGKKNIDNWNTWLNILKELGYKSYYQDLNSKDYGVAQNRNRTFCVSLLSDLPYVFPEPILLKKRLKDYLEEEVNEKYYINSEKADKLINDLQDRGVLPLKKQGVDLTTRNPNVRDVSNTIKTLQRGITNFSQDEIGVVEKSNRGINRPLY